MKTFYHIAQKYIGLSHYIEPNNSFEYWNFFFKSTKSPDFITNTTTFFMFQYLDKIQSMIELYPTSMSSMCFIKYSEFILLCNDKWINSQVKQNLVFLFYKIQKTYFSFLKLLQIYKYKKATIKNTTDLGMNTIYETNKGVVKIFQNDSHYLFNISELINMFNHSLGNTESFFANPLITKNPYNNIPFNLSSLYYIYFKIKTSTFLMPVLFHYFFLCDFNIFIFKQKYEYYIREYAIQYIVYKSNSTIELLDIIFEMLNQNSYTRLLKIDNQFPTNKLIEIMRPFVYLYYRYLYALISSDSSRQIFYDLYIKLKLFYFHNPAFGRKFKQRIYLLNPDTNIKIKKTKITFNENFLHFNDI